MKLGLVRHGDGQQQLLAGQLLPGQELWWMPCRSRCLHDRYHQSIFWPWAPPVVPKGPYCKWPKPIFWPQIVPCGRAIQFILPKYVHCLISGSSFYDYANYDNYGNYDYGSGSGSCDFEAHTQVGFGSTSFHDMVSNNIQECNSTEIYCDAGNDGQGCWLGNYCVAQVAFPVPWTTESFLLELWVWSRSEQWPLINVFLVAKPS